MTDVVDAATRSRMMSGIRSRDTKPELEVRRFLHAHGFRFRLHDNRLPGKPDLVLAKWKTVVFVHGCFWHMHTCRYFKLPKTRTDFWRSKLESNRLRDESNLHQLEAMGWRVLVIYECALRDKPREALEALECTIKAAPPHS